MATTTTMPYSVSSDGSDSDGCGLPTSLDLPPTLRQRVLCRVRPSICPSLSASPSPSFILYLPTVVLRKKQNPAFSLACHLANHYNIPLITLAVVLDDDHLVADGRRPIAPVVQTARRLAFVLEALQSCTRQWQDHGSLTLIRVHGPRSRQPHHLTLAHQATAVVMDEPFVEPYRTFMRRVVKTCRRLSRRGGGGDGSGGIPCYTVDGSTTVPPCLKLRPAARGSGSDSNTNDWEDGDMHFTGAPAKAWRWEEQTKGIRKTHVYSACRDRALDAPELKCQVPKDISTTAAADYPDSGDIDERWKALLDRLPANWKQLPKSCHQDRSESSSPLSSSSLPTTIHNKHEAPGQRPWTVDELAAIRDCKDWAMTCWDGVDVTVPPCRQTHGSEDAAIQRWKSFVQSGRIKDYAKSRNRISEPHAVSRISCYLNLGILSIFDVIHDVWQVQSSRSGYVAGTNKFLDEIIKFREGSYVHCFSTPYYHLESALPTWSRRHLNTMYQASQQQQVRRTDRLTFEQLSTASTGDEVWDAMQGYLIDTGELHNNARMTWGKTVVHWQAKHVPASEMLHQLVCLNDRYALDGLSPPSYFGLLWCAGFQDKPSTSTGQQLISTKWASQYRQGSAGFEEAMSKLYDDDTKNVNKNGYDQTSQRLTKKMRLDSSNDDHGSSRKNTKSILSYFLPANNHVKDTLGGKVAG